MERSRTDRSIMMVAAIGAVSSLMLSLIAIVQVERAQQLQTALSTCLYDLEAHAAEREAELLTLEEMVRLAKRDLREEWSR